MVAMAALLKWPDDIKTILALRLLTALRRCLFRRRSLIISWGRKRRTLTVSFMTHLQVKTKGESPLEVFYTGRGGSAAGNLTYAAETACLTRKLPAENGSTRHGFLRC